MNLDDQLPILFETVCQLDRAWAKEVRARNPSAHRIYEILGRLKSARRDLERITGCPISEIRFLP